MLLVKNQINLFVFHFDSLLEDLLGGSDHVLSGLEINYCVLIIRALLFLLRFFCLNLIELGGSSLQERLMVNNLDTFK